MRTTLASVALAMTATVGAAALSEQDPASVGMSADRLHRITALSQRYVDEGKLAGVVSVVARDGAIVHFEAVGQRGADDDRPLTKDALFRIFSMTKPITAVAAMILYEEGLFQLTDPVDKFVPEFAEMTVLGEDGVIRPAENKMNMQQLLSHTTGLSYGFNPNDAVDRLYNEANLWQSEDLDELTEKIAKIPLKFEPGAQWHYSVAVDITGVVVERLSGLSFDAFLKARLFDPLGMEDTFFNVPPEKMDRFLPNHTWDPENEKLVQLASDDFVQYTDETLFSGGGGLVSTAMDYLRFCEMMRRGGDLDGVRILSPKTVDYMAMDHLPGALTAGGVGENPTSTLMGGGFGFGLGFGVLTDTVASGVLSSEGEYNWGGAAGTLFWIDPLEEVITIGMIQLLGSPWPLRSEMKVLTYQAMTETK